MSVRVRADGFCRQGKKGDFLLIRARLLCFFSLSLVCRGAGGCVEAKVRIIERIAKLVCFSAGEEGWG